MTSRNNTLDPKNDIRGTDVQDSSLDVTEESLKLGKPIAGQSGSSASIIVTMGVATVSGLTGMTANSLGRFITISGAASAANVGTFQIIEVFGTTSVRIDNDFAITDANNGSISWIEREHYSLESDINFIRSDRANIKGVDFDDSIPTYQRPNAIGTDVPTNLANIAGKTTDATPIIINEKVNNISVLSGDGYVTLSGAYPYANAVNTLGFPISDGADAGDLEASFVFITGDGYDSELIVLGGIHQGNRIFGLARQGTSGIDGYSIEIEFRSIEPGEGITSSFPYTWEAGQDDIIDLYLGKRVRLDQAGDKYLRTEWIQGLLLRVGAGSGAAAGSGINEAEHASLRQLIHLSDADGPFEEFTSGAFREILGGIFPTSEIWWESSSKINKIVEKTIVRNSNQTPSSIEWKVYDIDGSTVLATVTDSIIYSGVVETSRTRTIS